MDKTLLLNTFEVKENPGLSIVDPRFNELGQYIQSNEFEKAADLAAALVDEEIYDIRALCYFLYGVFIEYGPNGCPEILQSLIKIFTDNYGAVGPERNKEKQFQNSVKWLFKQVLRRIEYEEKQETADWANWLEESDPEAVQSAEALCDELKKALMEPFEEPPAELLDGLASIKTWLTSFYGLIYKEPEPEPEEEEEEAYDEETEELDVPDDTPTPAPASPGPSFGVQGQGDFGNFHMNMLFKKINAFETLISSGKFEQASLVGFDISEIIDNFDPRLYLPEIFAKFSLLYATNIKEILVAKQYTQSPEWKALQELYKVDIDGFTRMDINFSFSGPKTNGGPDTGGQADHYDQQEDYNDDGYDDDYDDYDD